MMRSAKIFRWVASGAVLFIPFLAPSMSVATPQTGTDRSTDPGVVAQLVKRVEALEARVKELEAERAKAPTAVAAPAAAGSAELAATPTQNQPSEPPMEPSGLGPGLHIRGYTDITLHGGNEKGTTTSFSLGQVNLFITSDVSEKFKFLSEIVFEAGDDNAFGVDVERLLLQYSRNDYFNFAVGRYHTAIGYYNTAYHHSTWFQTATGRPFLFEFEDDGGILPIHNVGVSVSGRIPSGSLGLHYIADVGNGRASRSPLDEAVQNVVDENNHKSWNLALFARPDAVRGLQAGFSVYRDLLTPAGQPRIDETILAAHAVYTIPSFEWLNEAVVIRHAPAGLRVLHTPGFYTQISRRFGRYRPYFRYQYVNAPESEPIFADVGLRHGPSAGLRFDPSETVAFKLQYDRTWLRRSPALDAVSLQFAFTF